MPWGRALRRHGAHHVCTAESVIGGRAEGVDGVFGFCKRARLWPGFFVASGLAGGPSRPNDRNSGKGCTGEGASEGLGRRCTTSLRLRWCRRRSKRRWRSLGSARRGLAVARRPLQSAPPTAHVPAPGESTGVKLREAGGRIEQQAASRAFAPAANLLPAPPVGCGPSRLWLAC